MKASGTENCDPIFNGPVEVKAMWKREMGTERYYSSNALLVDHMEVVGDPEFAKTRVNLDVKLGGIAGAYQLEDYAA